MILNNSQLVEIRRMVEMVEIWSKHKLVTKGGALLLTSQTFVKLFIQNIRKVFLVNLNLLTLFFAQ